MAETKFLDYAGLQRFYNNLKAQFIENDEFAAPLAYDSENDVVELNYTDKFKLTNNALDLDFTNIAGNGLGTAVNGKLTVIPADFVGDTLTVTNNKVEVVIDGTTIVKGSEDPNTHKTPLLVNLDNIIDGDTIIKENGVLKVDPEALDIPSGYTLPAATASTLGGVKIGNGVEMTGANSDILGAKVDNTTIEVNSNGSLKVKDGAFATLVDGKVPAGQLPSYVDDVIEGYYDPATGKFYEERTVVPSSDPVEYTYSGEITGEEDKIYIDLGSHSTYRYGGSTYVEITSGAIDIITDTEIDTMMGITVVEP